MAHTMMNDKTLDRRWLVLLLIVTAVFRLWTLMMIHTGIDERDYWYSAKAISTDADYLTVNHRTIRWGVILPTAAGQLLTGTEPNGYYLMPFLNALAQTALIFALGRKLFNRRIAVIAALAMIFFPYQIRAASQVRPEIFSVTYILALTYVFILWLSAEKHRIKLLAASALLLFLAYETKITNLFFMPGFFALILMYGGKTRIRDCFIFGGIPLILFIAETIGYGMAGYPGGQLAIIQSNHLDAMDEIMSSYLDVFLRYVKPYLQAYWQIPFAVFAGLSAYTAARGRRKELMYLIVPAFSFFFFITFTVTSLHPMKAAEPFINRYFSSVLPFVFLVIGYYADVALGMLKVKGERLAFPTVLLGTLAFAGIFSLPFIPGKIKQFVLPPFSSEHPFALNVQYADAVNKALDEGVPIVSVLGNGGRNAIATASWDYVRLDRYKETTPPDVVTATVPLAKTSSGETERTLYTINPETLEGISLDETPNAAGRPAPEMVLALVRSPFRAKLIPYADIAKLETEDF